MCSRATRPTSWTEIRDIITEINGKKVKDTHELLMMIAAFRVGRP